MKYQSQIGAEYQDLTLVTHADGPVWSRPAACVPVRPAQDKADSFSRASIALILLGLLLVGGAIAPLLTYFNVIPAATYWIGFAYIALATATVMWLAGKMFAHSLKRTRFVQAMRVAALAAGEAALLCLTMSSAAFSFAWEATAIALAAVLLVAVSVPKKTFRQQAYGILRGNEIAVMFVLAGIIATARFEQVPGASFAASLPTVLCYGAVLAIAAVLVVLRVRELVVAKAPDSADLGAETRSDERIGVHPLAGNAGFLVMTALAVLALTTAFVWGCTPFYDSMYAYDIVVMAVALLCTLLGFAARRPALRHIGIVFALLAVCKMALIDTWSYDLLAKAAAYLVGGAVCFAIGAMYNYAVKKIAAAKDC